jgi:hypothetical protein
VQDDEAAETLAGYAYSLHPKTSCITCGMEPVAVAMTSARSPIGAIKRCFTNRTGEQHGIQARPIHRHGRPDVDASHGLTAAG